MTTFLPREPVCFISTHLDDVALSCSHFVAAHPGICVVTVFTGAPAVTNPDGPNEKSTGKPYVPDALQKRRDEDVVAMAVLKASPRWLGLWESEYSGLNQDQQAIANALAPALAELNAMSVVAPLGFHHSDHEAVGAACLDMAKDSQLDWYLYLDMPYAQAYQEERAERLMAVSERANLVELEYFAPTSDVKRAAVQCYESQLHDLWTESGFERSMSDPEEYWRLDGWPVRIGPKATELS